MALRPDGRFAAGTFAGAGALGDVVRKLGLSSDEVADVLEVPRGHIGRILEGSMPLPTGASYARLAEVLDVIGADVPLALLHAWQRDDAATRAAAGGTQPKKADDDRR
jgi:plasmid maintenance system antidote protein VapI